MKAGVRIPRATWAVVLVLLVAATGCSNDSEPRRRGVDLANLWRTDKSEPYPFTTPIPPLVTTPLDGTFTRSVTVELAGGRPAACRRCAPYRIEAGISTLTLELRRFHVHHSPRHWQRCPDCKKPASFDSRGHFTLSGDTIILFNDPNCPEVHGRYQVEQRDETLVFSVIEDDCFAGLRERFLTLLPWNETD